MTASIVPSNVLPYMSSSPRASTTNRIRGDADPATPITEASSPSALADEPRLGAIRWFGGRNNETGRTNTFGFIATPKGDVYFHQSQARSPLESLTADALVVFKTIRGKGGSPAAGSVQVLSMMTDEARADVIKARTSMPAQDVLTIALSRAGIAPCESDLLSIVATLSADSSAESLLREFWIKFPPVGPNDPFYSLAPDSVKAQVIRHHYAGFCEALSTLFQPVSDVETTLSASDVYKGLDARDDQIARLWAGIGPQQAVGESSKNDALLAKMLSARAAEKAVKRIYEARGATVGDISIEQLGAGSGDWTTHDLLIDGSTAIDVKNSRRPVSGKAFYVEHTIPRFKFDRQARDVTIAGVLSPYLQLKYLREPSDTTFKVEELIFLGVTSRQRIDHLVATFAAPNFEVTRANERTFPNWVFGYPDTWYTALCDGIRRITDREDWPQDEHWRFLLNGAKLGNAIPALCIAGRPLPDAIASTLSAWQLRFYTRLQGLLNGVPALPTIFLAVLTDFLTHLKQDDDSFSPSGYWPLLYVDTPHPEMKARTPLGAIDPLDLVGALIGTLTNLWKSRSENDLTRFTSFRFSGLGILQGRAPHQRHWITLIAYCGGIEYRKDKDGNVAVTDAGVPLGEKGKCGNTPLVIGADATCAQCGRLTCAKCGFCSLGCQETRFRGLAAHRGRKPADSAQRLQAPFAAPSLATEWWPELPPIEAYEGDLGQRS